MKQETLEEVAKKAYLSRLEDCLNVDFEDGVKLGAKWQQQNSNVNALHFEIDSLKREIKVLKHQQEKSYNKEDMMKSYHCGKLYQGREGDTTFQEFIKKLN